MQNMETVSIIWTNMLLCLFWWMYPAWGSVVGETGRGSSPWRHQCINISLFYEIVLGHSLWLWNPFPLEEHMFWALRSKKCRHIYLFRGISDARLLEHERCRAAGNEQHLLISLPDVKGFMRYCPTWSICYLLWDHFHLLTYWTDPKTQWVWDTLQGNSTGCSNVCDGQEYWPTLSSVLRAFYCCFLSCNSFICSLLAKWFLGMLIFLSRIFALVLTLNDALIHVHFNRSSHTYWEAGECVWCLDLEHTVVFVRRITFNLHATKMTKYLLRLVAWNQSLSRQHVSWWCGVKPCMVWKSLWFWAHSLVLGGR